MSCPKCGEDLELDPDGGWCNNCGVYWDMADLGEQWNQEDGYNGGEDEEFVEDEIDDESS